MKDGVFTCVRVCLSAEEKPVEATVRTSRTSLLKVRSWMGSSQELEALMKSSR